jgi:CMP-N,N'-diacetyllegionaminic acid synthase
MSRKLVIIPARGGSKGIHRKNLHKVNGIPLIDFTIDLAKELLKNGFVDYIHVSTEDDEIYNYVNTKGISILFKRPVELAGDFSKTPDVLVHSVNELASRGLIFDDIITLQVTSPIRELKDVVDAYELYQKSNNESLVSVVNEEHYNIYNAYIIDGNKSIPLRNEHNEGLMRQEIKPLYFRNGSIYITKVDYLIKYNKMISDNPTLFEMSREKSLNIDSLVDIKIMKGLLKDQ